jgi:transcriptional regulator with XRE-family HTH domain
MPNEIFSKTSTDAAMYDLSVIRDLRKRNGLTLDDVQSRCGITPAVLSRIERNMVTPELETLYRLARVFGMTATDLLSLAEQRSAHTTVEETYANNGFSFRKITYGNISLFHGHAVKGAHISSPEIHHNEYEICWVLRGRLQVTLPGESHPLGAGEAMQFDAVLEHTYEALDESEVLIAHVKKGMRF